MLETAGGILLAVFILFVLLRFLPEILAAAPLGARRRDLPAPPWQCRCA
jgi:hypothetical protein